MNFENILGNNKNKEVLKSIINTGNSSHSYIFTGNESIGKFLFAKEFAKGMLCLNEANKPCGNCKSCIEIDSLNNPDFFIIDSDENSIKIEQIRELNKKALEKPIVSDRKIYIINDSDKMTKEAQNSLLKTLEEPPEYLCIILISSNDNLLLNTIKSRCIKMKFDKLDNDDLKSILKEKFNYNNILDDILKIADGSINKVIEIKTKEDIYKKVQEVFTNIEKTNKIDMMNSKETIFKDKEEVYGVLEYINTIFFNIVKEGTKDRNKYTKCIEIIESTRERLNRNSNFDMTIDRMLMKVWEEIDNG